MKILKTNKKRKTQKKKRKFYKVELKISKNEKQKIDLYCKVHNKTSKKVIKQAISEFLKRNGDLKPPQPVSANQMNIFDIIGEQNS
jgi:hypothetical protein